MESKVEGRSVFHMPCPSDGHCYGDCGKSGSALQQQLNGPASSAQGTKLSTDMAKHVSQTSMEKVQVNSSPLSPMKSHSEGHSIFHTTLPPVDLSKEGTEISEAWHQYLDAWVKVGGAGTHLSEKLSQTFSRLGNCHSPSSEVSQELCEIAGQFHTLTQGVRSCISKESGVVRNEVTAALLQLSLPSEQKGSDPGTTQEKVLLCLLLKAVQLLHKVALSAGESLEPFSAFHRPDGSFSLRGNPKQDSKENYIAKSGDSQRLWVDPKGGESPNAVHKQASKATSFLNKLGGKDKIGGTPSQSEFYVELPSKSGGTLPGARTSEKGAESSQTFAEQGSAQIEMAKQNGHIASQEEVDNVIALLSGCQRGKMQSIPEHSASPPLPNQNLSPGGTNQPGPRVHRKSEGNIGETYASILSKTNTWPSKPRGRVSLPADTISLQLQTMFDGLQIERDYAKYIQSVQQMHGGSYPDSNEQGLFPGNSMWSTGGDGISGWPGQTFPSDGQDLSGRWSAGQDSGSCSDESSNGDSPWSLGLDLSSAYTHKRRHSSSEDTLVGSVGQGMLTDVQPMDKEAKTRTWPMKPAAKQANTQQTKGSGDLLVPNHLHPPLQMQWSDPLASKSLSPWGASTGLSPALSYQGLSGGPAGGSTNPLSVLPPATSK